MPESNGPQPKTPVDEERPPTPRPETPPGKGRPRWPPPSVAVAVGGVILVLIALVVLLALRPLLFPARSAGIPLEITRVSSTSPLALPPPPIVEVGDAQVVLPVPVVLEAGGRSFPVQAAFVGEGAWPAYPDAAVWVYGTVVNYVLGLEATEENQALVARLQSGDPLLLELSNGAQITFHVTRQEEVPADDPALFDQSRPGLTLVLLGEGEEGRPAVFADFDQVEEPAPTGGPTVDVGQPVQVGDARVTVVEGHTQTSHDLPPGTMVYLVEFSLQNTGSSPLDAGAFVMDLVDGVGNRYLPSLSVAGWGWHGLLMGEVAPGAEVNGTAAYIVPEGLVGPTLTWVFGPRPGSELRARFAIPHTPSAVVSAWPEVEVLEAFLGEGGTALHVVAGVTNAGPGPLIVTADDISLSSSAGPGELVVAAPPFPWNIAAGESREVELQFARPEASSAIVTILGYTFEISGLP